MNHLEKANKYMGFAHNAEKREWTDTWAVVSNTHALIAIAEQLVQIASDMEFAKQKGFNVNIREDK